jgi:hypothetical protein
MQAESPPESIVLQALPDPHVPSQWGHPDCEQGMFGAGALALKFPASCLEIAEFGTVVLKHSLPPPSSMISWTTTPESDAVGGRSRFAPLALICTFDLPAVPDLNFAPVMPSGVAVLFLYLNPLLPLVFQQGLLPQVGTRPPGGNSSSRKSPLESYRQTR